MNRIFFSFLITLFFISCQTFAKQEKNYVKHTVSKGETITQIAQLYRVTPYDIYRLNPDAQNGIQENTVLLIPKISVGPSNISGLKTHEVQQKETLFGIAKQYSVTIEALEKANPEVAKEGLKIGQTIIIPQKGIVVSSQSVTKNATIHIVEPKETLFSIAKKYDTTVEKLEELNPDVKQGLPIGYELIIKQEVVKSIKNEQQPAVTINTNSGFLLYEVKAKETLFSLSKMFNTTQERLLSLNPEMANGVQESMIIKVPSKLPFIELRKEWKDLTKTIMSKQRKELVLLLPFNATKIQGDTAFSTQERLKKDGFLNMTLDFYAGALMAIDSAKTLGLNLDVKILDSQETRYSSNVENVAIKRDLKSAHAIIGPFYPQHVEKLAEMLAEDNVPVISPLRETTKSLPNLYQSMPPSDYVKNSLFDYIRANNGNMIALIDKKKGSSRQFIEDNYTDIKLISLNEKGSVTYDSIQPFLKKDKVNYFMVESASTSMIFNAINQISAAKKNGFKAEFIVLDMNDTYETDEVFKRIAKQNVIYPSLTRINETNEAKIFAKEFRKINNVNPNAFAVRGFDVTFDIILRLSQDITFEQTIQKYITEQVENKFDYQRKVGEGYSNRGTYILSYDEELTVKEIK